MIGESMRQKLSAYRVWRVIAGACAISAASIGFSAVAYADSKVCMSTWGDGYIKSIYLNSDSYFVEYPTDTYGQLVIEVYYPNGGSGDGETVHYDTHGFARITVDQVRNLLQLANAAFLSQTSVQVYVDPTSDCYAYDGTISHWKGLMLTLE